MPTKISVTEAQAQAIAAILGLEDAEFVAIHLLKENGRPPSPSAKWRMVYEAICENSALLEIPQRQLAMLLGVKLAVAQEGIRRYKSDKQTT